MKMKSILLSMLAVAALASCNKEDGAGVPDAAEPVNLSVIFDFSTLQSRAIDGAVGDGIAQSIRENLKSATLVAYDGDTELNTITANAEAITAIKTGGEALFHNVKGVPTKVVVILNALTAAQEGDVNVLQDTTFVKKQMVYESVSSSVTDTNTTDPGDGNTIYKVAVIVKPAMSRFEIGLNPKATIQFDKTAKKPNDNANMSREDAIKAIGGEPALDAAEKAAYKAWQDANKANTADMDKSKFKYAATYKYLYDMDESDAKSVVTVENVYMNKFSFDRAYTKIASYVNNGSNGWDPTATTAYAADGEASNMNDAITTPVAANQYAAYNLFPAAFVPHVILKIKMPDGITSRWFTFTKFVKKDSNLPVAAITAGEAYRIESKDLDDLKFKLPYETKMTVSYDGEPTEPVVPPTDPTDPKPEPEVTTDVRVTVTVSEWVPVGIKPVI